jgi:hypothetical protein
MREAITVIEIICSKPMMQMDTHVSRSSDIHWTYSMNAVHFHTGQVVTPELWINNLEPFEISVFREALLTCIIWKRALNRHRNRKYFETTPAATNTNTPTE